MIAHDVWAASALAYLATSDLACWAASTLGKESSNGQTDGLVNTNEIGCMRVGQGYGQIFWQRQLCRYFTVKDRPAREGGKNRAAYAFVLANERMQVCVCTPQPMPLCNFSVDMLIEGLLVCTYVFLCMCEFLCMCACVRMHIYVCVYFVYVCVHVHGYFACVK